MRLMLVMAMGIGSIAAFYSWKNWPESTSSDDRIELQDGREFRENEIRYLLSKFSEKGITNATTRQGRISVLRTDRQRCNEIMRSSDFVNLANRSGQSKSLLPRSLTTPTEQARLAKEEKLGKLRSILLRINGIRDVEIVYDQQKESSFQRNIVHSAVVTLWANEGHVIEQLHATTTRQIVQKSFVGMKENDVLVVDGDTGITFAADQGSRQSTTSIQNQLDLETTRQSFRSQCRKLLAEFGESEVVIQMALEKEPRKTGQTEPRQKIGSIPLNSPQPEAVSNGTGKINRLAKDNKKSPRIKQQKPAAEESFTTIKRLLGIEITIGEEVVENYLRKNMGVVRESTNDQFNRAVTALRNEITKKIIGWVRNQGVNFTPDLVSVFVVENGESDPVATTEATHGKDYLSDQVFISGVAALVVMCGGILFWQRQSRTESTNRAANPTATRANLMNAESSDSSLGITGSVSDSLGQTNPPIDPV